MGQFQLRGIREVLVLATTALAKQRASRLHTIGRWLDYFHEVGLGKVFVIAINPRPHRFARQAVRHKNHPAIDTSYAHAEIGQRVNAQGQLVMIGERIGTKFFRWTHTTSEPRTSDDEKSKMLSRENP